MESLLKEIRKLLKGRIHRKGHAAIEYCQITEDALLGRFDLAMRFNISSQKRKKKVPKRRRKSR